MSYLYSGVIGVRMSDEDIKRSEAIAKQLRTPKSVLIRRIFCEWLDTQCTKIELPAEPKIAAPATSGNSPTQKKSW